MTATITPPIASARPAVLHLHGDTIADPYAWLEDRDDPETLAYLEAENAYTEAVLAPAHPLIAALYAEMRGRVPERDASVPLRRGDLLYYTRLEEGGQYPLYCRRPLSDGPEELLLDGNALAADERFFRIGPFKPSPDQSLLAYGVDTTGAGTYTIHVKDLRDGAQLPERIPNVTGSVEWAADGQTLFYAVYDHAHRPYRLYRHRLGADPTEDVLVYQEDDESYRIGLSKTRSGAYLLLRLQSWNGVEIRYLAAADPQAPFVSLTGRRPGLEYHVEHQGERLLIASNEEAENFRLFSAPAANPARERWQELLPHRPDTLIEGLDAFADHLVVYERSGGLQQIRVSAADGSNPRSVVFPEPVYTFSPGPNAEYHSDTLRFSYSSLVTPTQVIDYDMRSGAWELRKQDVIPSGYDPAAYVAERLEAPAPDGARVPISLVYRRDRQRDTPGPALLIGYGAYGMSYDAAFDQRRISLLDRGFVLAIAHIRGGMELGRAWYEQGRLLQKKNTFSDFIACAEHLIAQGYTAPAQLAISGTSAGGLLMSAVINERPELFGAVLARVPWTNVIASLVKPELPLTVVEWDQWGNPADVDQYRYMRSYDPYEQAGGGRQYPHIMATAGLNDTAVPYWDPAKWVAKLRAHKADTRTLILRTNMAAGHSASSGRFSILEDTAREYAFLIRALGVDE